MRRYLVISAIVASLAGSGAALGQLVAAGQENGPGVAVIDVTSPASPVLRGTVNTTLVGIASLAVDPAGSKVLAGEKNGCRVALIDISNPAAPTQTGSLCTPFAGVSSVAVSGTRAVVGEQFGPRVALLDISGAAPALLGSVNTVLVGVRAVAAAGLRAVAGEENGSRLVVLDISGAAPTPVGAALQSGFAGVSAVGASGARAVAGQEFGPGVKAATISGTPSAGGSVNTVLTGVSSIALSGTRALAGEENGSRVAVVDVSNTAAPAVVGSALTTAFTGISSVAAGGSLGAIGQKFGPGVRALTGLTGTPALGGSVNTPFAGVSSVAFTAFSPPTPPTAVVPASLAFGVVRVNSPKVLPLTIQNTGQQTLQITNIVSTSARFTVASSTLTVSPMSSASVNVTFTPNAEANFAGTLTANTNDPTKPTISVALSGSGGLPHIQVSPTSINFGNVAVCLSDQRNLTVTNTGGVPLTVSAINLTAGPFSRSPSSLNVPGGASANVQVTFTPAAVGGASATLTLVNDDPDPAKQNLTVNLSGNGTPTPPPAISVSPGSMNFGATLVNFFIGKRVNIQNTSPCSALNVTLNTTVTSGNATFPVTTGDGLTLPPAGPVSGTVPAGSTVPFVVAFAPTSTGLAQGTLTITSNDPANPTVTVSLSGTGVLPTPSSVSMVLDRSGSMSGTAPGGTKMDALKTSGKLFVDLLIENQGDRLGSVEFDDQFGVLTPIGDVTASQKASVKAGIDALSPRGWTSIGGGLQTGLAQLSGATTARKVVMVFTDGIENRPPTIATVKPTIPSDTEVYSIGLGNPANISAAALSDLAITSNGRFFNPEDPLILRKDFVQVLSDAFRMDMAADPIHSIAERASQLIHVPLSGCDHRASFIVYWDNAAANLGLEIRAPDGTTYTPASPATNKLVRYETRPGYAFYQIAFPSIDSGPDVIGPPRTGYWQMKVTAHSLPAPVERYSANVLVESDFDLKTSVSSPQVGKPLTFMARLTLAGKPVTNARLLATLTQPLRGLGNVLAQAGLREADLRSLPYDDAHEGDLRAKAVRYLLERAEHQRRPLIPTKKTKLQLFDDGKHGDGRPGDGVYAAVVPQVRIEGTYTIELKAQAGICGGGPTRETTFSVYVPIFASPRDSRVQVLPGGRPGMVIVTFTPRDALGNFIGPGVADLISARISPEDGEVETINDNLNGSYSIPVVRTHRKSVLLLEIGGQRRRVELNGPRSPGDKKAEKGGG